MIVIIGADIWPLFTPFLGDLYAPSTFCHSIIVPTFFPIEPSFKVTNFGREGCPEGVEITMSGRSSKHISWSLQVFRTFRLTRKTDDGVETRIVKHFHFTEWELDSFPYISAFIELRRRVRQYMEKNPVDAPIIVHCRWARRHGLPFAFRVNFLRFLSAPPSCAPKCSVPTNSVRWTRLLTNFLTKKFAIVPTDRKVSLKNAVVCGALCFRLKNQWKKISLSSSLRKTGHFQEKLNVFVIKLTSRE